MKIFKKNPVFSIVLGTIIIIYTILSRFIDHAIFNLDTTLGLIIVGIGLLVFAILVVLPPLTNKKVKGVAFLAILIEFILIVYGSVSSFLLPAFDIYDIPALPILSSASHWFGFALVLHGSIRIVLDVYGKLTYRKEMVYLNLLFVILGVVVYERHLVDNLLGWLTFVVLIGFGIYLLLIGLLNKKGK